MRVPRDPLLQMDGRISRRCCKTRRANIHCCVGLGLTGSMYPNVYSNHGDEFKVKISKVNINDYHLRQETIRRAVLVTEDTRRVHESGTAVLVCAEEYLHEECFKHLEQPTNCTDQTSAVTQEDINHFRNLGVF